MELKMEILTAFIAGMATHWFYLRRGEHHMYGHLYLRALLTTLIFGVLIIWTFNDTPSPLWLSSSITSAIIHIFYLLGLYTSLVIYRLALHPLGRFPGPTFARLSAFWLSLHVRHGDAYKRVAALHSKYGAFLRIGPSDLSIAAPMAVELIYGPGSKCSKGPNYVSAS